MTLATNPRVIDKNIILEKSFSLIEPVSVLFPGARFSDAELASAARSSD